MNVLFLTSCFPKSYHSISNDVVLNCLINECKKKNKVFLATVGIDNKEITNEKNNFFLRRFFFILKKNSLNNEYDFKNTYEISKN